MNKLIEELNRLLDEITKKELKKNSAVREKFVEMKELLNGVKNYELSNVSPMIKFINAKVLLEN
jgi:hypothetical protein